MPQICSTTFESAIVKSQEHQTYTVTESEHISVEMVLQNSHGDFKSSECECISFADKAVKKRTSKRQERGRGT